LRRLRKPYALTLHGGNLPAFARARSERMRRLLASAALVTAPSDYLRVQMRDYRSDIVLVHNAIDAASFSALSRSRTASHLVWVRAFHAIYNPLLTIEVLANLLRHNADTTLTMLGPDK